MWIHQMESMGFQVNLDECARELKMKTNFYEYLKLNFLAACLGNASLYNYRSLLVV